MLHLPTGDGRVMTQEEMLEAFKRIENEGFAQLGDRIIASLNTVTQDDLMRMHTITVAETAKAIKERQALSRSTASPPRRAWGFLAAWRAICQFCRASWARLKI